MKQLIQSITRQQFALFICYVLLVALIYSKFALSVCMIALLVLALIDLDLDRPMPLRFNPSFRKNVQHFLSYKPYWILSIFFFIILWSGWYSEDTGYWLERLRLKIPFLLAPFAFASIPSFSHRQYSGIFYFLLLLMFFSGSLILINYLQNFDTINHLMAKGHPMPTPMNHIRYSLLLALSIIGGVYLILQRFYWKYPWERYLIIGLTLGLFAFAHILSVRSGLVTLYMALLILSLWYVIRTGRMWYGILTLVVLISLPLLAYEHIPSFRAKARYSIYDVEMYLAGEEGKYSDSERIISLQLGMSIGNKHPIWGIGAGDLRKEMHRQYRLTYPDLPAKMPHNQWVSVFAGTGIIGLFFFCLAFFTPLFYHKNYKEPLLFTLYLVVFISFMMENTLETSIGVALYLVLLLIGLNYRSGKTLGRDT